MAKNQKTAGQPMSNKMKYRLNRVVALVLAVLLLYVGANLFNASVVKAGFYQEYAAKQQLSSQTINANRGTIYSTNMSVLAQSATVWTVVLAPSVITNDKVYIELASIPEGQKDTLAKNLSNILGFSDTAYSRLRKNMDSDQRFITVKTNMTQSEIDAVQGFIDAGNNCVMFAKEAVAKGLSDILGLEYETVLEQAYQDNQYEVIKKKVEKEQADEVRTMISESSFTFISLIEDTKRYYPNNELACHVLGFTGTDNQGLYGVEYQYDDILQGTNGKIVSARDGLGNAIPTDYEQKYEAIDGNSIVLTIDENIQRFAENAVSDLMAANEPTGGALAIVMNVNTGEILAMANSDNYDPNSPYDIFSEQLKEQYSQAESSGLSEEELSELKSKLRSQQWSNKSIGFTYEPGSTFKVITASAALESGSSSLSDTFYCSGAYTIPGSGGVVMHCHKRTGHGSLDFKGAIVNSCNPAFIQIGMGMGKETFFDYFEAFGLTTGTGIDLPGEEKNSLYYNVDDLGPVELASESYGQSMAITPIQLVTAISAAVNGGYLVQPHVLKEVLDQDGNVVETTSTEVKRQVISEETSAAILDCMEAMIQNTKTAYVKGYRIAGKSGTSQVKNQTGQYVSSFIGVAPADDPEIAAFVLVDHPTANGYYASTVCGPFLATLVSETLSYLGYAPEYTEEDLESMEQSITSLIGSGLDEAKSKLNSLGLKTKVIGDGATVVDQMPKGGNIAEGGTVILYTESGVEPQTVSVPNVVGKTPTEANQILTNAGLNVSLDGNSSSSGGNAKVVSQSVAEGTVVDVGTVVTIKYATEVAD